MERGIRYIRDRRDRQVLVLPEARGIHHIRDRPFKGGNFHSLEDLRSQAYQWCRGSRLKDLTGPLRSP